MYRKRDKATSPDMVAGVSKEQHVTLKYCGSQNHRFWEAPDEDNVELVKCFRSFVKQYFWHAQARRCCYCSKELDNHQGSYDAEHILPKSQFPQFMFEFSNLAVGCKTCNGRKSDKVVCIEQACPTDLPSLSEHYTIVHPHLDDWGDYLFFDDFGRVLPVNSNDKGAETIAICGIGYLNAARLSDHFHPAHRASAQRALEILCGSSPLKKKQKMIALLTNLIESHNLSSAYPVLKLLETECVEANRVTKRSDFTPSL